MQLEIGSNRKFPRMFLALHDDQVQSLSGIQFVWPDRNQSQVLDISLSGLAVSSAGALAKLKVGQTCTGKVRLLTGATATPAGAELSADGMPQGELVPLQLTVVKVTAKMIGFAINSLTATGRMMIEQTLRDQLVQNNMRILSPRYLHPSLSADVWVHGPFDTNIFLWNSEASLKKAIVEYDNLILIYDQGNITLAKSMASSDEARGYEAPYLTSTGNVSMGASWLDRLIKLVEKSQSFHGELSQILLVLRAQRQN